jgi:hypothetical protein
LREFWLILLRQQKIVSIKLAVLTVSVLNTTSIGGQLRMVKACDATGSVRVSN